MAMTTTEHHPHLATVAAVASLSFLAACGGTSSTPTPPLTLNGVTFTQPSGSTGATLRTVVAGSGPDFGQVIYIDDGVNAFLQEQTQQTGGQRVFAVDNDNFVIISTPDGLANSEYGNLRLVTYFYEAGGTAYRTYGVLGRLTPDTEMASASGQAIYTGIETSELLAYLPNGNVNFQLTKGDTRAQVDFSAGTVNVTLDGFGASAVGAPVDEVQINGMTISGSQFSGGTLVTLKSGAAAGLYDGSGLQSSGIFTGWNDSNGTATGSVPAELGGAFVVNNSDGIALGRYAAD